MMAPRRVDEMYQWARENGRRTGRAHPDPQPSGAGFSAWFLPAQRCAPGADRGAAGGLRRKGDRTWGFHELSDPDTQEDTRLWTA